MKLTPFLSPVTISERRHRVIAGLQQRHPRASFAEIEEMVGAMVPTLGDEQRTAASVAEMRLLEYLAKISQGEIDDHQRNPYRTIDQVFADAEHLESEYKNAKAWTAPDSEYLVAAERDVDAFIGWEPDPPPESLATAAERMRIGEAYAEQARVLEHLARQPGMTPAKYDEIAKALGFIAGQLP